MEIETGDWDMRVQLILSEEGAKRLPFAQPEFPIPIQLGTVVGTGAAIRALNAWKVDLNELLASHRTWSMQVRHVPPAAQHGGSTGGDEVFFLHLSVFEIGASRRRLWLLTDIQRSLTMLLLPREYRQLETSS